MTSRKMVEVAELPWKLDLQLFADEPDNTPNLEDSPEFQDDAREFNTKMEKYAQDRQKPAETTIENEPDKVDEVEKPEVVEPEKPRQDSETNKAFQEMRKAREEAERLAKENEERAKRADALIAAQFGDQGITTVEQYEKWLADGEREKQEQRYVEAGLTPEEIAMLSEYPLLKQSLVSQTEQQIKEDHNKKWNDLYVAYPDLVESSKAFNEGKEPEWYNDVMKQEIARGASPIAAYRHAHFDEIIQKATSTTKEVAKQEALNSINSKAHMKPNGTDGADVDHVEIDDETMRMYRALNKGKSDAEIRKWHKKHVGG